MSGWAPPQKRWESPLHHGCVPWASHGRRGDSEETAVAAASQERGAVRLRCQVMSAAARLCQLEESKRV